jgi:hypothetical protein
MTTNQQVLTPLQRATCGVRPRAPVDDTFESTTAKLLEVQGAFKRCRISLGLQSATPEPRTKTTKTESQRVRQHP